MPRPVARVLQEFQNAVISASEPAMRTVIVGPHRYVREYPADRASIGSSRIGTNIEALMSSAGSSPTIAAVNISDYPDNIAGAVPIDANVKVYIEGYAELLSAADGVCGWQQNTVTTASSTAALSQNDRVVVTPTAVQIFEDLTNDFTSLGIVPGTDILKISSDLHNILEVQSPHRLLVKGTVTGSANKGFFTSADGSAGTAYTIGDNSAAYDNKEAAGSAGQRITWRKVYLFKDASADFSAAGVAVGHYLKIGSDIHLITKVVDENHLEVADGVSVTAPQNKAEFSTHDASANVAYSIGTQAGSYANILNYSLAGTGQRLASTSVVRNIYTVDSATQFTVGKMFPFAATAGAPANFRVEHYFDTSNKAAGTDGWQPSSVTVNPSTKVISVASNSTVTYLSSARRITDAATFVEYRSLRQDTVSAIGEVTSSTVDSVLGTDRTENALRRGVGVALSNAGSIKMFYLGIATDDAAGYAKAMGILANNKTVYCIVPLTQTTSILSSFKSHVDTLSGATKAKRRILVCQPGTLQTEKTLVAARTDGDAESSTTFFSPGADFIAAGVRAGDSLDITTPAPSSFVIGSVLSSNRVTITGDTFSGSEISEVGVNFSITREMAVEDQIIDLKTVPASFNNRRVAAIWPDTCTIGSDTEPGYYLACAVGGMLAAFPSHRMTTKVGIAGIDAIANSNDYFDDDQIEELVDAGYYMFEQASASAAPVNSQQYTTVGFGADNRDLYLSSVRNFDYIANRFQSVIDAYPGEWNVIEDLLGSMEDSIAAEASKLMEDKRPKLGAPLTSYSDLRIEFSETLSDKVEVWMKVKLPTVLNEIDMHLIST